MSDVTCITLLEDAQSDNASPAWGTFLELYGPLIERWLIAQGVQAADADDLRQEVMKKVVQELPKFSHNGRQGAFRCWLRRVTANQLRERWRREGRRETAVGGSDFRELSDELEDPDSRLSIEWDAQHDRHVCLQLINMVREEFRPQTIVAFRLVVLEGKKPAEVAEELGISANAVRIAQSRVVSRLRQIGAGLIEFVD